MTARFVVLKFGGTSVSTLDRWQTIAQQVRDRIQDGVVPILVCSALAGVTDALEALLDASEGHDVQAALTDLRHRHTAFASSLGVSTDAIEAHLAALERLGVGASMVGEVSPRVRARVLCRGELMLTTLAARWLQAQGLDVRWVDARDIMASDGVGSPARRTLSAHVPWDRDDALREDLSTATCVITQGFVGRDPGGHTVVLGRGGSDTSAAILAAKLAAERCEIWTDVPGMFTADPRKLAAARLLKELDYDEAQEVATTGAAVLHPRCLAPVREARIPLVVRCTPHPDIDGTRIAADAPSAPAQVKAISSRRGIVLVSMETVGMWQQVGFLADAFGVFATHGLSVDTVSTSETNVTVTLDPTANALDPEVLDAVVAELTPICHARVVTGCASVSLVGRGIRSILHRLAPALELFEEHRVHLVSQAASDLNLTFVVDEGTADRLLAKLHALLFAHRGADEVLGPTWEMLFAAERRDQATAAPRWWRGQRGALLALADRTPIYVYDGATLDARATALQALPSIARVLYAMKANPHPDVLRRLASHGLGFECVSPGEVARVHDVVGPDAFVLFTPNFAHREEYAQALANPAVHVTLDNLHPLEAWPELFAGRQILARLDPGSGKGHHAKVRTAGARSKFGVAPAQVERFAALAEAARCTVVGLHAHSGSGVLDPGAWRDVALFLAQAARRFPHVRHLDLGGGLGVPDRAGREALDLAAFDAALTPVRTAHPDLELWIEPGRYLVAEAGVLLARVTQLKSKGDLRYVGVDAGMHTLIRPALYGAHHPVVNLTRIDAPAQGAVTVVGPICETGDVLARDRHLQACQEGDVLLIDVAGAYGAAMASDYNLRGRPAEVLIG